MERELTAAAKLLPAMIADIKAMRDAADDPDAKLMILASLIAAALLLLGLDPETLQAFVDSMGPEGEVNEVTTWGRSCWRWYSPCWPTAMGRQIERRLARSMLPTAEEAATISVLAVNLVEAE